MGQEILNIFMLIFIKKVVLSLIFVKKQQSTEEKVFEEIEKVEKIIELEEREEE